jgi:hypothetical protein
MLMSNGRLCMILAKWCVELACLCIGVGCRRSDILIRYAPYYDEEEDDDDDDDVEEEDEFDEDEWAEEDGEGDAIMLANAGKHVLSCYENGVAGVGEFELGQWLYV